jgi:calcium-dependent protein kinase
LHIQCAAKGVVYRDVKTGNFLFLSEKEDAPLKATDFGLAIRHRPGDEPLTTRAGTPAYMVCIFTKSLLISPATFFSALVPFLFFLPGQYHPNLLL